jgi:hypothetical protein
LNVPLPGTDCIFDRKMQKSGRLPQAPASLLVQLPADELLKFQNSRADTLSSTLDLDHAGSIQASDLTLLATSIQQRREREERVFAWQQRLIDAGEELTREELKRAVSLAMSLSESDCWFQVRLTTLIYLIPSH